MGSTRLFSEVFRRFKWRLNLLGLCLLVFLLGILWRAAYLGSYKRYYLMRQSSLRTQRIISTEPRSRGIIMDRFSDPLAVSVPSGAIWVDPKLYQIDYAKEAALTELLGIPIEQFRDKMLIQSNQRFKYLARQLPMTQIDAVMRLKIPGIYYQESYKRYYPHGKITAQLLGTTDLDDHGKEGLELMYENWLNYNAGKALILKDGLGQIISQIAELKTPSGGYNLKLSIDGRLQLIAYQELEKRLKEVDAESGSVVIASVATGEILAMVNAPSFDPNKPRTKYLKSMRNRAVTDLFEPGSTAKIFTAAAALASGQFTPNSLIDTNPGVLKIDGHKIYDALEVNNGVLTLTQVLQKSSDIGTAKIALQLPRQLLLDHLKLFGFGQATSLHFPGERSGVLPRSLKNRDLVTATLSFGYAFNVTLLQLVQAYSLIASGGWWRPLTILKTSSETATKHQERRLSGELAKQLLDILEACTANTNHPAKVPGYTVAGKTGTSHLNSAKGGYYADRYSASFMGIAPASNPKIVIGVVVRDPHKKKHFGSQVAAPLFSRIASKALHLLNVPFDKYE